MVFRTVHSIRVGSWGTGRAGGRVVVVIAGVARGAGLSVSTGRQTLCTRHTLQTDLRLNPFIDDLCLQVRPRGVMEMRHSQNHTHSVGFECVIDVGSVSPCLRDHRLCGSGNSPFWNKAVCFYTPLIPQLGKKWNKMNIHKFKATLQNFSQCNCAGSSAIFGYNLRRLRRQVWKEEHVFWNGILV